MKRNYSIKNQSVSGVQKPQKTGRHPKSHTSRKNQLHATMNTQSQDTKTGFAWNKTNLNSANQWATALCAGAKNRLFYGGNDGTNNNFYGRSLDNKSWDLIAGPFNETINSMCSTSQGDVYFVGPKASNGRFALFCCYGVTQELALIPGSGQAYSIDHVCVDGIGNLYMTGKFVGPNGYPVVMQYNIQKTSWEVLGDTSTPVFPSALAGMCADSSGNVYVIGVDASGAAYLQIWNGTAWGDPITSSLLDINSLDISCDNNGNVYTVNSTSLVSYNTSTKQFNPNPAPFPSDMMAAYVDCIDNVVYIAGYTDAYTSFVLALNTPATGWNTVTPTEWTANTIVNSINDYSSQNNHMVNVLIGSNGAIWDGSSIHTS